VIGELLQLLRYAVAAVAGLAALAALGSLAVQRRTISPFGRAARLIRRVTDRLLAPFERRILRAGGNPQSAPWWLIGTAIVGGILVVTVVEWLIGQLVRVAGAASGGAGSLVVLLVDWTLSLLMLALVVRVIGSWIGASRYGGWMRPFVALTEWFLAPLRRALPAFGPFDLSPLVAWFLLSLLRSFLLRSL
jgi:YggT family protein